MTEIKNFGRVIEMLHGSRKFSSVDYNIEATVPFDDDLLPNESEIKLWNLADSTIKSFKRNSVVALNAGYRGDVGTILTGYLADTTTVWQGADKITTLFVLDCEDLDNRVIKQIAFAPGTLASTIIKQLASYIGLPVAQFELLQDVRYLGGYTASGKVTDEIAKVAADCKTSIWINKTRLYVRNLRRGGDAVIKLNKNTGLIGSPEYFSADHAKGYKVVSQLQHRMTTASVIDLECAAYTGRLHVRSGQHKLSRTGDFQTEAEAVI